MHTARKTTKTTNGQYDLIEHPEGMPKCAWPRPTACTSPTSLGRTTASSPSDGYLRTPVPELLANVRDAAWLSNPRHDGPGGHRAGAWAPKYHVSIDHPRYGESWSACGLAFLIEGGERLEDVPSYQSCQKRGCRELWPANLTRGES